MNRSYSKIRHIQESNLILEQRRFYKLLESKMGDVRPLVSEQVPEYLQRYTKAAASTTDTQYTNRNLPPDRFSEPVSDKTIEKAYLPKDEPVSSTGQDVNSQYNSFGKNAFYWQYMLKLLGKNLGTYGPKRDGVDGDFGKTSKTALKSVVGNENMDLTNFQKLFNTISKNKNNLSKLLVYGKSLKKNVNNLKIEKTPLGGEESSQITVISQGRKFNVAVKNVVKNAPRINQELAFINARTEYIGVPFFICDPKNNLVLAFDEDHNLIDYSQSIAGQSKQSEKIFTYKEWCELSQGIYDKVYGCKDAKLYKNAKTEEEKQKVPEANFQYTILKNKGLAYTPKGILQVRAQRYMSGYSGQKGIPNSINLQTGEGENLGAAIHALAMAGDRPQIDSQLKKYLSKEKEFGTIPQEYYDVVNTLLGADQSAGCFNVDPKFVQNPSVLRIAVPGTPVFVMGDTDSNYLVQVKPEEVYDFFTTLGYGKDGSCVSPSYLIQNYTTNVVDRKISVV